METNEDNCWVPMDLANLWQDQNGISRAFIPGDGGNASSIGETLINFLKGADPNTTADDDPRLMIYSGGIFDWPGEGDLTIIDDDPLNQIGPPPGQSLDQIEAALGEDIVWDTYWSRINVLLLDRDDPYMIMNAAEAHFLMAEALERGIGSGMPLSAQEHYNAGVTAAMTMWTAFDPTLSVDIADVTTYLATYPYGSGGPTGASTVVEEIHTQLWASRFLNWWEAWTDWRRTGYPTLVEYTVNDLNVSNGKIFRRLQYDDAEVGVNPNFNQASDNNYTSPVWWDVGN
jgi:hypothetical protein